MKNYLRHAALLMVLLTCTNSFAAIIGAPFLPEEDKRFDALEKNASIVGTMSVAGNFAVNTNKFTVAASSGNTLVAGTLGVTGASTLSSTLKVSGNMAVGTNTQTYVGAYIAPVLAGASEYATLVEPTLAGTSASTGLYINNTTAAATAITSLYGEYINTPTIGATGSVTNMYGLYVAPMSAGGTLNYAIYTAGGVNHFAGNIEQANLLFSATAPTVASGFCTSPSVPANNGTAAFTINVGTSCGASTGVITLPTAATSWNCFVNNITHPATSTVAVSAHNTTSVTLTNYVRTTGIAGNWTDSDVLNISCIAY